MSRVDQDDPDEVTLIESISKSDLERLWKAIAQDESLTRDPEEFVARILEKIHDR